MIDSIEALGTNAYNQYAMCPAGHISQNAMCPAGGHIGWNVMCPAGGHISQNVE